MSKPLNVSLGPFLGFGNLPAVDLGGVVDFKKPGFAVGVNLRALRGVLPLVSLVALRAFVILFSLSDRSTASAFLSLFFALVSAPFLAEAAFLALSAFNLAERALPASNFCLAVSFGVLLAPFKYLIKLPIALPFIPIILPLIVYVSYPV